MVLLVRGRDESIRRALGRPIVGKRICFVSLGVCVLALKAFLLLLLRGHVPRHEIGISFLDRRLFIS